MRITERDIDHTACAEHRAARREAVEVAESLRDSLQKLGFVMHRTSQPDVDLLVWPTLHGGTTVSGEPQVTLGRLPIESAEHLDGILANAVRMLGRGSVSPTEGDRP